MCVCICLCFYAFIWMCAWVFINMFVCMYLRLHGFLCLCLWGFTDKNVCSFFLSVYFCALAGVYLCINIFKRVCLRTCVRVYAFVYVCTSSLLSVFSCACAKHFYLFCAFYNTLISLVGRVFTNGPGDLGSTSGRVMPKTLKMELDTSLLNTQQYKVRIKGKVEQSRERSSVR